MTVEELKRQIEDGKVGTEFQIYQYSDNDFVPMQYVHAIAKQWDEPVEMIEDVAPLLGQLDDIFGVPTFNGSLKVLKVDEFECSDTRLNNIRNLIIVCKGVEKNTLTLYNGYVVKFPKLEEWQIKDYVYSIADGVDSKQLDWLISVCNNDIYRLQKELSKLSIFTLDERKNLFNSFIKDGVFNDLSQSTIFNLTNALIQRNIQEVFEVYKDLDKIDTNEMGFLAILYNGFKNVINVQLSINPTAESCGLKPNQFYAIRHNIGHYSKDQLLYIFGMLTNIDKQIKVGELQIDNLIDYIILNILNC